MMINTLLGQAAEAWNRGDIPAAEQAVQQILRIKPNHAGALQRLATIYQFRGDTSKALIYLKKSAKSAPADGNLQLALAGMHEQEGDGPGAIAAYRKAAALLPDEPRGLCGEASVLERMHLLDEANEAALRAVDRFPKSPIAATILARIQRRLGNTDRARQLLERTLDQPGLQATDEYPAAFEYAKLLDTLGEYDRAFRAFFRANAAQTRATGSQALAEDPAVRMCEDIRTFSNNDFASWRQAAKPMPERIAFLFGFPRSGTTMTDRILGAHEDVVIIEEQPTIRAMHGALGRVSPELKPIPELYPTLNTDHIELLREAYRQAVRQRLSSKDARRWKEGKLLVLDKFPLQITSIATISRVLPDAKVLVALRDPRDVCLSCFMQLFSLNRSMVQLLDLQRTVSYYNRVMSMWADVRDRLALDWLEVRYEDTVADFAAQTARVLAFLGLDPSADLSEFHRHEPGTLISTPSYEAVSKPINDKAIGRWKNYREHIPELIEALRPLVERFGYESDAV